MLAEAKQSAVDYNDIFQNELVVYQSKKDEIQHRRSIRQKICTLEASMLALDGAVTEIDTTHRFSNGVYAREVFIPKGMLLTGKIHKTEHLNIISKGEVSVLTEFGSKRMVAPCTFVSDAWTKRVVYAHEDTIWTVLHATESTDLDEIEAQVISKNYDELEAIENSVLLALEDKGD